MRSVKQADTVRRLNFSGKCVYSEKWRAVPFSIIHSDLADRARRGVRIPPILKGGEYQSMILTDSNAGIKERVDVLHPRNRTTSKEK